MFDITEDVKFDDRVVKLEYHTHQPYSTLTYSHSDEIRIMIRQLDLCTLPSESYIYLEGALTSEDGTAPAEGVTFVNNGFSHLFDDIRYEIAGVEIDRSRNCGITSTLKGYCSFDKDDVDNLQHAGWKSGEATTNITNGNFSTIIPLKTLLGFAEDYKRVIVQMQQELILSRGKSDNNALFSDSAAAKYKLTLNKVTWNVPYVTLSDEEKINLFKVVKNDRDIAIAFRSWELYEYPAIPSSNTHNWSVKSTSGVDKARYIIIAFQTDRKDVLNKDSSKFDHCNLRSARVWLNSEYYPYENVNVEIAKNNHVIFYDQYLRFKSSYYNEPGHSLFNFQEYTTSAPIFVIDCSKQSESVKSGNVDIRIELQANANFPDKTSLYALIIHDKVIEYTPSKNLVRKL